VKFKKRLDYFAFCAAFSYDLLSHNRLLIRRLRLEPNTPTVGVSGSLYYTSHSHQKKGK
jgi:hypothetical protein